MVSTPIFTIRLKILRKISPTKGRPVIVDLVHIDSDILIEVEHLLLPSYLHGKGALIYRLGITFKRGKRWKDIFILT